MIHRVLILGYVWPEPRSSAAGSRMMQFIHLFLQQGWQVIFASAAQPSIHRADLGALGVEELTIALNCDSFNAQIAAIQPDMVLFDRFFTEEQFGWRVEAVCPQALRVLDTEDLHSLRNARELQLKQALAADASAQPYYRLLPPAENTAITPAHDWIGSTDMGLREVAAIYRCDLTLMISGTEVTLLENELQVAPALLHYCPFLLDDAPADTPSFDERVDFISIGNFRHQPNWDAVLCLKNTLWPAIRAQLPEARLHLYGAYPPPKATALHNPRQGFLVDGWVDDAPAAMRHARVCLAPLRFGAGLKGKLVEAMQAGTPSVTTTIGAESMHADLPWPGAIATDNDHFVAEAVQLYRDEKRWQPASQQGASILAQVFPRQSLSEALIARLRDTAGSLAQHRRRNIVGGMLRHHLHKSHQYMSQWIAAKNRG